ncbi:protein WEAK CHLOROPLAST MOVEMENT UNDER BLUE LIGHT 1-like isoform X2 [Miscanthus floridulus]|uniref:protein WEAK CHLOROPLAST MOVEMENT UNDER BLUE LIGHT 1-like isoform X2 n=1 Tax=Miscanthus floridulus TaxID=154761 RepID=UPI00345AEDED
MEEANVHGTSGQPSTAPDASPESAVPSSSDQGSQSCQAQRQRQVHQLDETQEPDSSDKASEIASRFNDAVDPKASIDTAAPIDSVKGALSKFGVGGVDWKEKRKQVQDELDQVQEEVTEYQKRAQEAEAGRAQALRELGTAVNAADELRLGLEMARAEQTQAREQAELAELRLEEVRRGAAAKAKAELDAVRERRAAVLADLRASRTEAESLEKVRARAAAEAGAAVARAREAAATSREAAKAVEDLAAELVALKGELESSRAAHVEAEEKRMDLAVAWEEDKSRWQIELEEAELESKRLREELVAACDVEMKAEAASQLLASLKAELFAWAADGTLDQEEKPATISTQSVLEKTKKELDDVKASVERAKDEAKCLRVAAASMRDALEKEKVELTALRRREREREGLSPASIPYLEEELRWLTAELAAAEARAKADDDESKMAERVGEARREAEEAKAKARSAREEVARAREDAGVAKAAVAAMEARLEAVTREILAANTSEEMATASAGALLQESKPSTNAQSNKAVEGGESVTLMMEEYDELSRRAQETEEAAGMRVVEAVKLIKEAKDAEVRRLEKVARLDKRTELRRQALEAATLEAEEAEFEKLSAERELRQWRAEHEQRRAPGDTGSPRPGLAEISVLDAPGADEGRGNPHIVSPRGGYMPRTELWSAADADADARQRKTFFPRIVMFLARKRAQTWK